MACTARPSYGGNYSNSFAYDNAFNTTTFRGTSLTFNLDNQFSATDGGFSFAFDGNGNPTDYQSSTANLTFDPENRQTAIGPSASPTFTATSGPDDERVSKTATGTTRYFVYDEASGSPFPLLDLTQSGSTTTVVGAYGFAADGIRSRFVPAPSSSGFYTSYSYDPMGNYSQGMVASYFGNYGLYAKDTAVFDSYGALKGDIDTVTGSPETGLPPVAYGGEFGNYTDQETHLLSLGHRHCDPGQ